MSRSRREGSDDSQDGKLLVFEGPDGVGKTTLARALAKELTENGDRCEYLAFPGNTPGTLGKHVYNLHHAPGSFGLQKVHPVSLQLLHVASHVDSWNDRILPALRAGRTVILDRYWWSTWVYGLVAGADPESLELMLKLEKLHTGAVLPRTVFLIRRTVAATAEHPEIQRLLEEYRLLASREAKHYPVVEVCNDGSPEQTLEEVRRWVEQATSGKLNRSAVASSQLANGRTGRGLEVFASLAPAKPTIVYDTYWRFAAERQAIFFRRLEGTAFPWTNDRILQEYKFTNAYRALDRVSQFLIRHIIYEGDDSLEEVFFRTLLFKLFNRIETWRLLMEHFGEVSHAGFSIDRYSRVLTEALAKRTRIYSAAYIMPSGGTHTHRVKKHEMHLHLIDQMMRDELPKRIADAKSMRQAFDLFRAYPTIGDFLAYQYVTDINYSEHTDYSEMEFVAPGPGARDGLRKCFSDPGGLNEAELIRAVTERQSTEFQRLGIDFATLWGRPLQLIDCQNLFCEVDKYARLKHPEFQGVSGRTRIKQKYHVKTQPIDYFFPPKWHINDGVEQTRNGSKRWSGRGAEP